MDKSITNFHHNIEQQVHDLLLPVFLQKADEQHELLTGIVRIQQQLENDLQKLEDDLITEKAAEYTKYLEGLSAQISAATSTKDDWKAHFQVDSFVDALNDTLSEQPKKLVRRQRNARFKRLKSDTVFVKVVKPVKNQVYRFSKFPSVVANKIRASRKKEKRSIRKWKHTIPWAAMVRYHYGVKLLAGLTDSIDAWAVDFLRIQRQLRDWEDALDDTINDWAQRTLGEPQADNSPAQAPSQQINVNSLKKQNRQLKKTLHQAFDQALSDTREELAGRFPLAGTFELPRYVYTLKNLRRKTARAVKTFQKSVSNCYRYLFQIQQDWIFDRQISISCLRILTEFQSLTIIFNRRKEEKLLPSFVALEQQVNELKKNVESTEEEIKMQLLAQKRLIARDIGPNNIVPLANDVLELDSPALVHRLVSRVQEAIASFDQSFWLTREKSISENLKDADFYLFDPQEIIDYEMMPQFQQGINELKTRSLNRIDALKKGIDQIDNILLFNLEGAIEACGEEEESPEKARSLAAGGIERALNKIEEERKALEKLFDDTNKDLRKLLLQFFMELHSLSDNENAILLRLKLTRTRTLQQTVRYRDVLLRKGRKLRLRLLVHLRHYSERLTELLLPWKRRIGLAAKQSIISSDLSEFLSFATESIGKLPAIYQRLYKVSPLTDKELFVGRTAELREVRKAVDNWKKGGEASILLTGEKWSGRTSILNYFTDEYKNEFRFIRCNPAVNASTPEEFLQLWGQWLSHEPFESLEEVASHLKTLPGKWCVLLEDVQKLFLRYHGGIQNVRLLLDLISDTQRHCFWFCTITQYARDYLDNTLQLSEHFSQRIQLGEMKNEQITEVILRRNNISGYKIVFLSSGQQKKPRSYDRWNEEERQAYLQAQFFKNLNKFSRSNISSALMYWLLSTRRISEDAIEIGHFDTPDFSFLENLSHKKVLALYSLILHDGLTEAHFIDVLNILPIQSKRLLKLLTDDGVILEKEGVFTINPLLFKPTVDMLRAKNFIY